MTHEKYDQITQNDMHQFFGISQPSPLQSHLVHHFGVATDFQKKNFTSVEYCGKKTRRSVRAKSNGKQRALRHKILGTGKPGGQDDGNSVPEARHLEEEELSGDESI